MIKRRGILAAAIATMGLTATMGRKAQATAQPFLTQSSQPSISNPQSLSIPVAATITSVTATLRDGGTVPTGATVGATVQVGPDSVDVVITTGKRTSKATCSIPVAVGEIITWFPTQTGMSSVPAVTIVIALT